MHTAEQIRNAGSLEWSAKMIAENMAVSDKWLIRGLLRIHSRQTHDERDAQETKYSNGVGFNGSDARKMTGFAEQVIRWNNACVRQYSTPLSVRQIAKLRLVMPKYAVQLARCVRESQAVTS